MVQIGDKMNQKFKAFHKKYGMSDPFELFEEIEFHKPKNGGMSYLFKPTEILSKRIKLHIIQFIGLTDVDHNDIYEGDLIQQDEIIWLVEPIGTIEHDNRYYGICVSNIKSGRTYIIEESILQGKVIGNIFENPEIFNNRC